MNVADAAARILEENDGGGLPLARSRSALAAGLISPKRSTPWPYVAAAVRKEKRRRSERGEAPRFEVADGRIALARSGS